MKLKLLVLTFLIISLAVTPTYAQPVFRVHTDKAINMRSMTYFRFGGGIYVYSENAIRVTAFFENVTVPSYAWFNYTVGNQGKQYIYNSILTASTVWMNGEEYTEDFSGFSDMYWSKSYGVVTIDIGPSADFPANVSIAYAIPVEPGEETVSIEVVSYAFNTTTNATEPITAGSVKITDLLGNESTIPLPAMFSLILGQTYTLTFYGDAGATFYGYATPDMTL